MRAARAAVNRRSVGGLSLATAAGGRLVFCEGRSAIFNFINGIEYFHSGGSDGSSWILGAAPKTLDQDPDAEVVHNTIELY